MRATVLGAGIQGTCAALALREAGWEVRLLDRASGPLLGASAKGEGKIHLGLVYGNEPHRATASLMIDGAMEFGRLLERWVPRPIDWGRLRSNPFHYGVMPDTMVAADVLRAHYGWVADEVRGRFAEGASYLGERPTDLVTEVDPATIPEVAADLGAAFRTAEVALDARRLRPLLVDALRNAEVSFRPAQAVRGVERASHGFIVECAGPDGSSRFDDTDIVVNCCWDGRLAIDATLGVTPPRPWVYRLKQSVEGRLPSGHDLARSFTFALGPYGDVVVRTDGRVYASWYPTCMIGWSDELAPPDGWRWAMSGDLADEDAARQARRILDDFAAVVPVLRHLEVDRLQAGVIAAWGTMDIDDPASELHSRHSVGVHAHDGYYSIDTGKLTTAPLFADRLLAHL